MSDEKEAFPFMEVDADLNTSALPAPPAPPVLPPDPEEPDAHGRLPAELWAKKKGTEAWKFRAVAAGKAWPIGKELTEKDYDEAIQWLESEDCIAR